MRRPPFARPRRHASAERRRPQKHTSPPLMRALCLAGSPAAKTRNHNHAHASRRRSAAPGAHCCSGLPRAAREATAPTAQQTMVSLGDLAPPEKPTGRRYLTGRPDGQRPSGATRALPRAQAQQGRAAARQEGDQEPGGGGEISWSARAPVPGPRGAVGLRLARARLCRDSPQPKDYSCPSRRRWSIAWASRAGWDRRNGIPKIGLKEVEDGGPAT